jgi:hypothetical protein
LLPGLGLVVWGPIAAGLAWRRSGGLTGGLIGATRRLGIPEERARIYENGIKNGGTVLEFVRDPTRTLTTLKNNWTTNYNGQNIYR